MLTNRFKCKIIKYRKLANKSTTLILMIVFKLYIMIYISLHAIKINIPSVENIDIQKCFQQLVNKAMTINHLCVHFITTFHVVLFFPFHLSSGFLFWDCLCEFVHVRMIKILNLNFDILNVFINFFLDVLFLFYFFIACNITLEFFFLPVCSKLKMYNVQNIMARFRCVEGHI